MAYQNEHGSRVTHFRDLPAEPTECEIAFLWSFEQTAEDLAEINSWNDECRAVARGEFVSREPATVNQRRAA